MNNAPDTATRTQLFEQMDAEARRQIAAHLADAAIFRDLADAAETAGRPEKALKLLRQAKGHQAAATRITKSKGWS